MKKNILFILPAVLMALGLTSCEKDEIKSESVISVDNYIPNEFDLWLEENYRNPYNIDFKYRYEEIESDLNYYTVPATYEASVKMAHLVKYLCVETYNEVAGIEFTRSQFPKMFFLIGEWEYRNNGSFILGTAEETVIDNVELIIPFEVNETVKVVDGPFSGFSGVIEEVNTEKRKLKVMVKIFGRKTPLELAFTQVEKE